MSVRQPAPLWYVVFLDVITEYSGGGHNDYVDIVVSIFGTPCLPAQGENAK